MSGRLVSQVVRAFYVVIVARWLGPESYGVLAFLQASYLLFLPLTTLGTREQMAVSLGRSRRSGAALARQILGLRMLVIPCVAVFAFSIGLHSSGAEAAKPLLVLSAITLAGRALANWSENAFVACEAGHLVISQEAYFRAGELLVAVIALVLGGGVVTIMAVHATAWWLQALWGLYLVDRRLFSAKPVFSTSGLPRILRRGSAALVAGFGVTVLTSGSLVAFGYWGRDATELGQLGLALQIVQFVALWPALVGQAALPALSSEVARGSNFTRHYLEMLLPWLVILGGAASVLGTIFAPSVIPLVFGDAYAPAGVLLGLALASLPLIALVVTLSQAVLAAEQFSSVAVAAAGGLLVWLMASSFAANQWGASGALLGISAGAATWTALMLKAVVANWQVRLGGAVLLPAAVPAGAALVWLGLDQLVGWMAAGAAVGVLVAGSAFVGARQYAARQARSHA